jgi:hypothetical protein
MSPLLLYTANAFVLCFRLTSGLAILAFFYSAAADGPTDWSSLRWLAVVTLWGELAAQLTASLAAPGARVMYGRTGVAYPAAWLLAAAAAIYLAREAPDEWEDDPDSVEDDG